MNQNGIKMIPLSKTVEATLPLTPKMARDANWEWLRNYAIKGEVAVEIFGLSNENGNTLGHFFPVRAPGVKRFIKIEHFRFPDGKLPKPLKGLFP